MQECIKAHSMCPQSNITTLKDLIHAFLEKQFLENSTVHLCENVSEKGKNLWWLTWQMPDGSWWPQRVLRLHFLQLCPSENILRLVPVLKKDIFIFPSSLMSSWLFFYNQVLKKVNCSLNYMKSEYLPMISFLSHTLMCLLTFKKKRKHVSNP